MSAPSQAGAAAQELAARLGPDWIATSGPAYEAARRIWNGAVHTRPALVVRARTQEDVQAAVLAARRHELPLSVRGGGHDISGRGLRQDGLVIDLTGMRRVVVDPAGRVATAGGGTTAAGLLAALAPHGLAAVTGTVGSVGVTGLTLVGGYGPLTGRHGLALDNVLGAEVVLADGRVVTADAEHEPELFWALRGGGGNFGVVTSVRLRAHPLARLLAGVVAYPGAQAATVLDLLGGVLAAAPDSLTVPSAFLAGPDGSPALFLMPVWSGDPAAGERHFDALRRLGTPVLTEVLALSPEELLHRNDAWGAVTGLHFTARSRSVAALTPHVVEALTGAARGITGPMSGVLLHHFHGAATRVPVESTAFGLRQRHLMVEIVAGWEAGDAAPHRAWAESVADSLAPDALPGGYPGMLDPAQRAEVAHSYGPNTARLLAAKARFDPDGVFTATALPPVPGREPWTR
ncbi:FAD-binding oxidoreductase [Streptomyces sp. NPDC089424]|uniref:FAD-binding oxidoreductase n=1 Tax=Streptomyces sp. NPDC089424 TaxID=3365917 RepID=UPI003809B01E